MPLSADIQQFISSHGNSWTLDVNTACEAFFEARHAARPTAEEAELQCSKGLKYGPHTRNRLDIYQPASEATSSVPVVVYIHGGGFRAGDNDISSHMHGNIARYFAVQGMVGVLVTYRLLPEARYPDGMEDVSRALRWIKDNISQYGGDANSIFCIGQSAGGSHAAMALFSGLLKRDGAVPRGLILQSAPFWYDLTQDRRRANMMQYYGTSDLEAVLEKSALGLFKEAEEADVPLLITVGEYDPEEICQGNLMLVSAYLKKMRRLPIFEVLQGHNHISYALSIGLEGHEVGPRILEFIEKTLATTE